MNKIKIKKHWYSIISFVLTIMVIRSVGMLTVFPDRLFPLLNKFFSEKLSFISARFDFSVGDIFYAFLTLAGIIFLIRFIRSILVKSRSRVKTQTSFLFYFLIIFYLVFHLLWGFNYYKTSLKNSYYTEDIYLNELKELAQFYLQKSIEDRKKVKENPDGVFEFELTQEQIDSLIMQSSKKVQQIYSEVKFTNNTFPNIKPSQYSTMFSYLGVLGYYNPFTNEGQYNNKMPHTKLLFTQMHETAHQWGVAPENEANFIGFLLGSESDRAELRYVSHYMALRQILNRIVWEDPKFVEQFIEKYSPGMKRDRTYEIQVQLKYNHKADDAFSMLNEAYLRLNNQGGLESYGKFVELLVGYNRKYAINKE